MQSPRKYDFEDRTLEFARGVSAFVERLPRTLSNVEYCKQVVRSSGSVGANYIEANEALGKKDFLMRIKICRKEAEETRYGLQLINCGGDSENKRKQLIQESTELMKISGAILEKSK